MPLEDVLYRPATACTESGSGIDTGADGATGALRRLLALMLNDALLMRFVMSSGLPTPALFAYVLRAATQYERAHHTEQVCEQATAGTHVSSSQVRIMR